ncbi:hypothetical protein [Alkalihalobacillus deserti]|uniref:hypothetical protein n=1 Tax=Alkalihalobacillus deserti TaxID=2879466 RepID=UPI001D150287|nr:hypothetical protein [Alkalihalobacillus deserti]
MDNKKRRREKKNNSATDVNKQIQREFYGDNESDDITHLGYFINSVNHNKRRE